MPQIQRGPDARNVGAGRVRLAATHPAYSNLTPREQRLANSHRVSHALAPTLARLAWGEARV